MSVAGLISVAPATLVDGEALLDTAVASVVAGLFVTLTASLAIYGFATAAEMRRLDRGLAAVGAGALALVSTLAFAGAIVLGLAVMIDG
ncbi:MAG: hypothetical protein R2718_10500 [Solirubrobacterales bacterium]|nr:hypothetical protein [Solirubrobacterales bacterium]